ncbi:MAG: alpha/beta fold hydrolase [Krumholzibacteria bacterium]|nr:alpha/beta fold hydrolase [Candidatus Krumholzibacteria bacterium]
MSRILPGCLVVIVAILAIAQDAAALKPESGHPATPADYGIIFEEVAFQSADGVTLAGWFYPAQDTAGIATRMVGSIPIPDHLKVGPRAYATLDDQRRPTIVIGCGEAGNMSYLISHAFELFTHGYNVFTFDCRGFGTSGSWSTDEDRLSYSEYLLDYNAAIDYTLGRDEVDADKIGLFGFSTGGYLAFAAAAMHPEVSAISVRGIITSFDDVLPILREQQPGRAFSSPPDYPRDLLPLNAAPRLSIPVFLIVGEKDLRTPPWMSQRVFENLAGPKELWIVTGATHGGQTGPEFAARTEFFQRLRRFFRESLSGQNGITARLGCRQVSRRTAICGGWS